MSTKMNETCMIFVDISNVWIEAQKFAASGKSRLPKLQECDQDPRYRVDIGKLVKTISNGRSVKGAFLYGSRPSPNDAEWNSYERFGFKVNVYDRAKNGREKQVDTSMAADISRQASMLEVGAIYDEEIKQQLENMTFIVISGDLDMLPSIVITLECGIPVEVWAWESGMSNEYKRREDSNLRVSYLDQVANRALFASTCSTQTGKIVEVDKTVVLCELATEQTESVDAQTKPWRGWDLPKPLIRQSEHKCTDPGAFDEWETVGSRNDLRRAHRRTMQRTQACPYGLHCREAGACGNYHTDKERTLFRDFPSLNFAKWRTSRCRSYPHCPRGTQCAFAHSDADAWCSKCHKQGHYEDGCRFGVRKKT
ncbi:unnamed protein product [Clonostachys byssicola]|uniref:C3H1-type domain-containing protein n=1 Tax=Clonostachys byssicola TaxID=160290 RepID=A0A9N9U7V8_9HYPO|nr:unnamed protein product [Clonostachys byssicola]